MAFVPVLVWIFTAAALASPCSASNELVTTLTVSIDSRAGVYMGYVPLKSVELVPSIRVLLPHPLTPLKTTCTARDGLAAKEPPLGGVATPGTITGSSGW